MRQNRLLEISLGICFALTSFATGCGSSLDLDETGQQVGDSMASIDEAGGTSGSLALNTEMDAAYKTIAKYSPRDLNSGHGLLVSLFSQIVPRSEALACSDPSTFSACTNNVVTRTFGGCTIGLATLSGTVTLTYTDAAIDGTCSINGAQGYKIVRVPNFTLTGLRGATLSVSKTGSVGQSITRGSSASTYAFSNDGIRRVFQTSSGGTLFDYTSMTTSDMTITGNARTGRTLNGGTLRVTNNTNNVSCDFSPSNVTWGASCNCATSGTWSGTCSDGKTASISIQSCGSISVTVGSTTQSVTLNRCY